MTLQTYLSGFALSIILTLLAPLVLWFHNEHALLSSNALTLIFVTLALLQLVVQLIFFLHLGEKNKPHENKTLLAFALIIVCILVGGTLWIMNNVEHLHTMPQEFENGIVAPENQLQ